MRMFNADGGEAEMCGNALRCVAKHAFDTSFAISRNDGFEQKLTNTILAFECKMILRYKAIRTCCLDIQNWFISNLLMFSKYKLYPSNTDIIYGYVFMK